MSRGTDIDEGVSPSPRRFQQQSPPDGTGPSPERKESLGVDGAEGRAQAPPENMAELGKERLMVKCSGSK